MCRTCCKDGFNDRDVGRELSWNKIRSEADLGGGIDARARNNETNHSLMRPVIRVEGDFYLWQRSVSWFSTSFKSTASPFLAIVVSMHSRSFCVRSEGVRWPGLYTSSTIVKNSSDASSTDIRSFANMIAINLFDIRNADRSPVPMLTLLFRFRRLDRNVRRVA